MATIAQAYEDRRMSMGRVFERAFATIIHNPLVTLGLAFLFGAVPSLLSSYATSSIRGEMMRAQFAAARANPHLNPFTNYSYEFVGLTIFSWALAILIAALTQAVLTRATVAESEGRKAGFGESVAAALRVLLPLAALMFLLILAVMVGLMLFIVPGIILYVMWSVASPALVEERRGVFGSFGRSRQLTKGARWKIFAILLVVLVLYWIFSAVAALAVIRTMGFSSMTAAAASGRLPIGYTVVILIVSTLINIFWGTVQASTYVELRQWKQGGSAEQLEEVFA